MIYPFVSLIEMEMDPPDDGFDVYPVVLQFEVYVRFVIGIAYDRCRQFRDNTRSVGWQRILDRVLNMRENRASRTVSYEIQGTCISQYRNVFADWCTNNGYRGLTDYIPENKDIRRNAKCILVGQCRTITLGEYFWNILLLIETIQKMNPEDNILPFLERSVFAISIFVEMRNRQAHDLTEGYWKELCILRKWLQEQGDPVFAEDNTDGCCTLIGPRVKKGNDVTCSFLLNQEHKKGSIPYPFIHRDHLVVEYKEPSYEFESVLFVRIPGLGTGKEQYFRLSPFITVKKNMTRLKEAEYGMLLNNTKNGVFRYRNIQIANSKCNQYGLFPDNEDYPISRENMDVFEKEYCFFINSIPENISEKMKIIGARTQLYRSKHPEFNTAINLKNPFPYYSVMDDEGIRRMDRLQKKQNGISFIFLTGHGGLGKTHLVLHLLRTKYNFSYSPKDDQLQFDQIAFLSAKQSNMHIVAERIEKNLDHDIEDYQGMIYLLADIFLGKQIENPSNEQLLDLESELINNKKKQLVFIDDLDTMKLEEQKKVCRFFDRFKSEEHRVLITSRVVPPMLSSLVSPQTTIMLHPLDSLRSLEFCRKYNQEKQLIIDTISASDEESIFRITSGIPLNLVLLLHLMQQAYNREQLYRQAQVLIKDCTNFIFDHILDALEEQTRRTFGMLIRFGKAINLRNQTSSIGFDTLHLLVPSLSDMEYANAIEELEYYAITAKSEDNIIHLRSDIFLEITDDITLNADSQSIIKSIEQNPEKWRYALADMAQFMNYILEISKAWANSGDKDKRRWANNSAQIALSPRCQNYIQPYIISEWQNLLTGPDSNKINELTRQMEVLRKHDPRTEESIRLVLDRYNRVLDTLEQCEKYWPENRETIDQAFALCAEIVEGLYYNSDSQVENFIYEMQTRLGRCYEHFFENADECVSPRCEEFLSSI